MNIQKTTPTQIIVEFDVSDAEYVADVFGAKMHHDRDRKITIDIFDDEICQHLNDFVNEAHKASRRAALEAQIERLEREVDSL